MRGTTHVSLHKHAPHPTQLKCVTAATQEAGKVSKNAEQLEKDSCASGEHHVDTSNHLFRSEAHVKTRGNSVLHAL